MITAYFIDKWVIKCKQLENKNNNKKKLHKPIKIEASMYTINQQNKNKILP